MVNFYLLRFTSLNKVITYSNGQQHKKMILLDKVKLLFKEFFEDIFSPFCVSILFSVFKRNNRGMLFYLHFLS